MLQPTAGGNPEGPSLLQSVRSDHPQTATCRPGELVLMVFLSGVKTQVSLFLISMQHQSQDMQYSILQIFEC